MELFMNIWKDKFRIIFLGIFISLGLLTAAPSGYATEQAQHVVKGAMSGKIRVNKRKTPRQVAGQLIKRIMQTVGRTSETPSRVVASKRGISSIELMARLAGSLSRRRTND
jgi:hypothetical protein